MADSGYSAFVALSPIRILQARGAKALAAAATQLYSALATAEVAARCRSVGFKCPARAVSFVSSRSGTVDLGCSSRELHVPNRSLLAQADPARGSRRPTNGAPLTPDTATARSLRSYAVTRDCTARAFKQKLRSP